MRSIQIYHGPYAGSYEVECDTYRPVGYPRPTEQTWLPVADGLARALKIEEMAERLLREDVFCCDSSLVTELLNGTAALFSWDDVENLYPDPSEWTAEQCVTWCEDHGEDLPDKPEDPDEDDEDLWLEDLRETVRDNADAAEVYEWWRVTPWLLGELREVGEPVLDHAFGEWWGRTCTGQSIMLDGTLQAVASRVLNA